MSKSTSVRMPEEMVARLKSVARQRGTTMNRLIVETLNSTLPTLQPDESRADIALADIIGSVSSEGCNDGFDSSQTGRFFAEGMIRKHSESRL